MSSVPWPKLRRCILPLEVCSSRAWPMHLSDMDMSYPGQYHWVAVLSNAQNKSLAAYATGWISVGGQITLTAAAAFSGGLQIQALITLNDDSYTPQRWQGMLIYWAVLAYAAVQNIWGIKLLPHVNLLSGMALLRTCQKTLTEVLRHHSHRRVSCRHHRRRCHVGQEPIIFCICRRRQQQRMGQRRRLLAGRPR